MTPKELKAVSEQNPISPESAAKLVEHTQALQDFVIDLAEWLASQPGPMKIATYYQIKARAQQLRNVIDPPKSLVMH